MFFCGGSWSLGLVMSCAEAEQALRDPCSKNCSLQPAQICCVKAVRIDVCGTAHSSHSPRRVEMRRALIGRLSRRLRQIPVVMGLNEG